mmetsp:Transcript_66273/g.76908  ORF Transcript_66273/g.76908 Transcript_66273/m.76908 type:complete len:88 (-) Transcript_66273:87-350(-)|eukprot:CAMPEP_0176416220 /NCGR_PEP_ID=MMETSP0127-20121128/6229_1 /TAXON_ID=938130 /ORGANISM="Platyophrya macrostoma, Strain WH" /LENGTH=87 /DNA_ID=CAMNT_0017796279 /DNA_START=6 /DNA_END=269 /DNA_ORIENTATION=-
MEVENTRPHNLAYKFELKLPDENTASIIKRVLEVDKELNADEVTRELTNEGNLLRLKFTGSNAKKMRAAIGILLENMALALETMEQL